MNFGNVTQELLNRRSQMKPYIKQYEEKQNRKPDNIVFEPKQKRQQKQYIDEMVFEDSIISDNIIFPYNIKYNSRDEEDEMEETYEKNFCEYSIYFLIIIILFAYTGFTIAKNKILPPENIPGISVGIQVGFLMSILLWNI